MSETTEIANGVTLEEVLAAKTLDQSRGSIHDHIREWLHAHGAMVSRAELIRSQVDNMASDLYIGIGLSPLGNAGYMRPLQWLRFDVPTSFQQDTVECLLPLLLGWLTQIREAVENLKPGVLTQTEVESMSEPMRWSDSPARSNAFRAIDLWRDSRSTSGMGQNTGGLGRLVQIVTGRGGATPAAPGPLQTGRLVDSETKPREPPKRVLAPGKRLTDTDDD